MRSALAIAVGMVGLGSACTTILGTFDDNGRGTGGAPHDGGGSAGTTTTTASSTGGSTSSGSCTNPAVMCHDGLQDCSETDVDCGGGVCAPCADGDCCNGNTDCTSGFCYASVCLPASCNDHQKDGNETDVDCGGTDCPECPAGKHCNTSADCINNCVMMVCD
jgi:hypothetical protein